MNSINILGVKVRDFNPSEIFDTLENAIQKGAQKHLVTLNPEFLVEARSNREFKQVLNNAEVSTVDGVGLVFAGLLWGKRLRRLTGVRLTKILAEYCANKNYRMYLLGGLGNSSEATAKVLRKECPLLEVSWFSGSENIAVETEAERQRVINRINDFKPHVLLVAYGSPQQDLWIERNRKELTAKLMIGVGGVFDYLSGQVPRAPKIFRALGLEWLVRLLTNPRKRGTRILKALVVFPVLVVKQKLRLLQE